jgi:hypothetical protein
MPLDLGEFLRRVFATSPSEREWMSREDFELARSHLLALVREQPRGREARYAFPTRPPCDIQIGVTADVAAEPCEMQVVTLAEAIERVEWFMKGAG